MSGLCPQCYLFCIQQTHPNTISCTVDIISTYFDITWQVRSGAVPDIEQSRESWFRQVAVWCGIHDDSRSDSRSASSAFRSFSILFLLLHASAWMLQVCLQDQHGDRASLHVTSVTIDALFFLPDTGTRTTCEHGLSVSSRHIDVKRHWKILETHAKRLLLSKELEFLTFLRALARTCKA